MNLIEATHLLRAVKAFCPSQHIDEFTFEAWAAGLDDIRYEDASAAVLALGRRELEPGRSRYIELGHVRGEVRRIRQERLDKHPHVEPPSGLGAAEFLAWHRRTQDRIASGEVIERPALVRGRVLELGGVLKSIPDE